MVFKGEKLQIPPSSLNIDDIREVLKRSKRRTLGAEDLLRHTSPITDRLSRIFNSPEFQTASQLPGPGIVSSLPKIFSGSNPNTVIQRLQQLTKGKKFPTVAAKDIRQILREEAGNKNIAHFGDPDKVSPMSPMGIGGIEKGGDKSAFSKLVSRQTRPSDEVGLSIQYDNALARLKKLKGTKKEAGLIDRQLKARLKMALESKDAVNVNRLKARIKWNKVSASKLPLEVDASKGAIKGNVREMRRLTGLTHKQAIKKMQGILSNAPPPSGGR